MLKFQFRVEYDNQRYMLTASLSFCLIGRFSVVVHKWFVQRLICPSKQSSH